MTFEQILPALKHGKKVKRKCHTLKWEGLQYIYINNGQFMGKLCNGKKETYFYMPVMQVDIFADDWEIAEDEANPPIESVSTKDLIAELQKRNNVIIKEVLPNTASTFVVNGYDGGKIVFTITEKTDN